MRWFEDEGGGWKRAYGSDNEALPRETGSKQARPNLRSTASVLDPTTEPDRLNVLTFKCESARLQACLSTFAVCRRNRFLDWHRHHDVLAYRAAIDWNRRREADHFAALAIIYFQQLG